VSGGDIAAIVSAGVAVVSMVLSVFSWWGARGEKEAAARHAADALSAANRSAAAQETQAIIVSKKVADAERLPWQITPAGRPLNCRLVNQTATPKYGVRVEGERIRRPDGEIGRVDGYASREFVTFRETWELSRKAKVLWHLQPDCQDAELDWDTELP
jgi:hypothetical protein